MKLLVRRNAQNWINTCLAAIFTLVVLLPLVKSAEAQADTIVQVSPSALDVTVGGSGTLSLEVLGGVEINAYDVTLRYDPALITFVSWSHGPYLSHLAQVYKVDEPGRLRLVFTQLATPPVSGDGILLNLVFRGAAAGTSEVLIEALDFAGADGTITNPQLIGGTIMVNAAQPTALPSNTLPPPTATPTLQPVNNTAVNTPTWAITAPATPDLKRTSPVMGTTTPTQQLTEVNNTVGASNSTATTAAVAALAEASVTELAEVPTAAPGSAEATVAVLRQPQEGQPTEALLNLALWAALGIFILTFVWLALVAIRRSKTPSSDKE